MCRDAPSFVSIAFATLFFACGESREEKCAKELSLARQVLEKGDLDAAWKQREVASKRCSFSEIGNFDWEYSFKRQAASVVKPDPGSFIQWAANTMGELPPFEHKECDGPKDGEPGWCHAYAKGTYGTDRAVKFRWWKDDPSAVEFAAEMLFGGNVELQCNDLRASKIRRWQWASIATCSHCKFTEGALGKTAWHAYVKNIKDGAFLHIMSESFLRRHSETRRVLENQGTTL